LLILSGVLLHLGGVELCHLLRAQGYSLPIVIISTQSHESDIVNALEAGADEYLVKPFSMAELVARCRALLRGHRCYSLQLQPQRSRESFQFKELYLDLVACQVTKRDQVLSLSPKEFCLLKLFMRHPQRVWTRDQLIDQIWGIDFVGDCKTVDVHIRWLREKLEDNPKDPQYVRTIRGFGYRFG
jgi:two-component system phosphate regulon response regulator PhoB